jgi:hypothetical protein
MPAAPPPTQGDHLLDVALRELGATRTSGSELAAPPATGTHPMRTDLAIGVRPNRYVGIRVLGALGYGAPIGGAPVPFSDRPTMGGGLGLLLGWWGDSRWSIVLEVETRISLLSSRDRYERVVGPCFEVRSIFGSSSTSCHVESRTGELAHYDGYHVMPTLGGTLTVAGWTFSWLRLGVGASVQQHVSRAADGSFIHQPVGIAQILVEARIGDFTIGIEAQQWIVTNVTFAPALGVSIGGVAFERPPPREPEPIEDVPAALRWSDREDAR